MKRFAAVITIVTLACASPAGSASPPAPADPAAEARFGATWHDGKAEMNGYRLTVRRYGQMRRGQVVAVFVTEPFSESKRVKVDDPNANPADTFDALKLNLVRDFQTGIYDYNTMASLFVRTGDLQPVKETFSSAEWCGHVYLEMLFNKDGIGRKLFSYFEGESADDRLPAKQGGVTEDALMILLRGLKGDYLAAGGSRTVDFLPGPFHARLSHTPPRWTTARIARSAAPAPVTVPAGTFQVSVWSVSVGDGRTGRFDIEEAWPHRIIRWSWTAEAGENGRGSEGLESAELTGSERLQYWRMNGEGDEAARQKLGLAPLIR